MTPVMTARRATQAIKPSAVTDAMVVSVPLIVGEDNPYGSDPRAALYPHPERSAGHRLATLVMGLSRRDYLDRFDRVNLCSGRWSMREARDTAARIRAERRAVLVLLGAKVCAAFGVEFQPFTCSAPASLDVPQWRFVVLPHPSGRCRLWNDPLSIARARASLIAAGAPVPP